MSDTAHQLPHGWRSCTLGAVADVIPGGTPSRRQSAYWGGSIPWFGTGSIDFNTIENVDEFITPTGLENSSAKVFPAGTLVMAMIGQGVTRGKVATLGLAAAFNQNCVAIVPRNGASSRYLFHFLAHHYRQIRTLGNAGNVSNMNVSLVRSLPMIMPAPEQQTAIARMMDTWDAAIERIKQLIRAKRRLKRGLMQQLLTGKRRFAEFEGEPWQEYHLGDVFTERNETRRTNLQLLAITADRGVIPREEVERKDTSNADKRLYKRIIPGDIGYNTMRMWQGVSAVSSLEGLVSPAYTVCVPSQEVYAPFISYLFKFPPIVHLFRRFSQGLVDDTLNLKFHEFAQIKVVLPPVAEQKRIAEVLATVDQEINHMIRVRRELQEQKRGLMQKLLTGQVRVPESMTQALGLAES